MKRRKNRPTERKYNGRKIRSKATITRSRFLKAPSVTKIADVNVSIASVRFNPYSATQYVSGMILLSKSCCINYCCILQITVCSVVRNLKVDERRLYGVIDFLIEKGKIDFTVLYMFHNPFQPVIFFIVNFFIKLM